MQLAEYLNRAGLSQKEFVAQVRERGGRLAQPTLSLVMSGLRQPSHPSSAGSLPDPTAMKPSQNADG